jgi:hypothetical protein
LPIPYQFCENGEYSSHGRPEYLFHIQGNDYFAAQEWHQSHQEKARRNSAIFYAYFGAGGLLKAERGKPEQHD